MKLGSKVALLVGAAAGYVLGTRAGRERYEQISERAEKIWNSDSVRKQRDNVENLVDTYVPRAVSSTAKGVGQIASGLGSMVFGGGSKPKNAQSKTQYQEQQPATPHGAEDAEQH